MKRIVRIVALALTAALLLASTGCGTVAGVVRELLSDRVPASSGAAPTAAGSTYFSEVYHGDVAYGDMVYARPDMTVFDENIAKLYELAENGGSSEAFIAADDALWVELGSYNTLLTLLDLKFNGDPGNAGTAEEQRYMDALYDRAYDDYWTAMHALSLSDSAELLEEYYAQWQIDWFKSYVPNTDEDFSQGSRETELEQEYYTLIGAAEPDYDALAEVFVELVGLRNDMASAMGYDGYADYAYEAVYARDYTPEDVRRMWSEASGSFGDIAVQYGNLINRIISALYAEDIDCSPDTIIEKMGAELKTMDGELYAAFDYMVKYGLYDIEYSESKVMTGYTTRLYEYNEPFIFNAPTNCFLDYTGLFHEFGHFVNAFYTESSLMYGVPDNELSELQSQGMELLFAERCTDIFGPRLGGDIAAYIIMNVVYSVIDGVMYDEFLQLVYGEENLTAQRVYEIFSDVYDSFGFERYDGFEHEWMYIEHNFCYPFYYISYAVSAVAAFELAGLGDEMLDAYLHTASIDTEDMYFSDSLDEIGIADPFSQRACEAAAGTAKELLKRALAP